MNKPWCIPVFAILILVFTFWETNASFWVVWIASALILIRSLCFLSECSKECCKPKEKSMPKKVTKKKKKK